MGLLWLLLSAAVEHVDTVKRLKIVFVMLKTKSAACKKVGVRGEQILSIASELPDTDLQHNMLPLPE